MLVTSILDMYQVKAQIVIVISANSNARFYTACSTNQSQKQQTNLRLKHYRQLVSTAALRL
jgi:hypothetical protein